MNGATIREVAVGVVALAFTLGAIVALLFIIALRCGS